MRRSACTDRAKAVVRVGNVGSWPSRRTSPSRATAFAEIEERKSRFRCTVARVSDEEGARAVRRAGPQAALGRPPPLQRLRRRPRARRRAVQRRGGAAWHRLAPHARGASRARAHRRGRGGLTLVRRHAPRDRGACPGLCRRHPGRARRGGRGRAGAAGPLRGQVDIAAVGQLEHALRSRGARVLGVEYTGEASLQFAIPPIARAVAEEIVAELTSGTAELRVIGQRWVDAEQPEAAFAGRATRSSRRRDACRA